MPGLLFLVIALIAYGSLYPWHFNFHKNVQPLWLLIHNWPQQLNRWLVFDIVLNVLLYVPLGVLAFLTFARRRRSAGFALISAAALGFAVSVSMELLQAYDLQRDTGPLDVVTNTTGSAIGAVLALLCHPLLEKLAHRKTRRSAVAAAALAVVWLGYQLYPFFPVFRLHRLRAESALLAHFPPLNGVEIWTGAAEWFAIWLVLDTLGESIHGLWLGAMLVLPLQIFIAGRALTWTDLLSAALGLLLILAVPARSRLRAGVAVVASAILLAELAPFHFSAHAARFSWIPLYATLSSERQSAAVILMRKAFDYGAAVWLLHTSGSSYARSGIIVGGALFVLELLQRYLPGRTAESTDPCLALLMALALWLASDFRPHGWDTGDPLAPRPEIS